MTLPEREIAGGASDISDVFAAGNDLLLEVAQAKETLEEVFDDLPDVYCIIDEQGRILKGNRHLARLCSRDQDELVYVYLRVSLALKIMLYSCRKFWN